MGRPEHIQEEFDKILARVKEMKEVVEEVGKIPASDNLQHKRNIKLFIYMQKRKGQCDILRTFQILES